jgi:uridine kinase
MVSFIGISGGSGSGKSTLAYGLQELYPDLIEVVHFDDYQKKKEHVPIHHGMANWDHPDAIDFDGILKDLMTLKNGKDITVMTKSAKYNPDYEKKGRIPHTLKARNIIIVEGYMVLTDSRIRDFFDYKIYLDLNFDERMSRRTKFIDPEYTRKILLPMHKEYVETSKKYADIVIDIGKYDKKEVRDLVIAQLKECEIL